MNTLELIKPDDWHVHLRDGDALARTVPDHAQRFARALVMPNCNPPITTIELVIQYRDAIKAQCETDMTFQPCMTLYLSAHTTPDLIHAAANADVLACKLYPAGVTTGSEHGINDIQALYPVFAAMTDVDMVLCIHGEVNTATVDVFDREAVFIDKVLTQLVQDFPNLRIVLEHITTCEAVTFVAAQSDKVAATITPHHLVLNRHDLLGNGIKPHYFCLPILKRQRHQQALIEAATRGDTHFFLGTDSAPHKQSDKQSACGCAGIYSGCNALEIYAQLFEQVGALDQLENFASVFGANFYQLPLNQQRLRLEKTRWQVPETLAFAGETVVPLFAGQWLEWKLANPNAKDGGNA